MNTNDPTNEHPDDTLELEEVADQKVIELESADSIQQEDGDDTADFGALTGTIDTTAEEIEIDDDGDMFEPESIEDAPEISLEDTEALAEAIVDEADASEEYESSTESNELSEQEQELAVELQLDKPVVLSDVLNDSTPSDDEVEEIVEEISDDEVEEDDIEEELPEAVGEEPRESASRISWLIYPIVLLGIFVRGLQYAKNAVLNSDEAALVYELLNRSLVELFQPLGEQQIAPVGYLLKVKMASLMFGDSEYTLRLYAFSSSIVALVLFTWLARKALEPLAAVLAVALVAFAWPVIHASALVSPVSGDMFSAVFMLMLGVIFMKRELTFKGLLILCVAGALLLWFSLPLVFVLIGVALALGLQAFSERDWAKFKGLVLVYVVWIFSFIVNYFIVLRGYLTDDSFRSAYDAHYLPIPSTTAWVDSLQWIGTNTVNAFSDPLGIVLPGLGLFVFLLGFFVLARSQRLLVLMLSLPIISVLIASAFRCYPFQGDFIQFLVPSLALCCAVGLSGLLHVLWEARRRAAVALLVLVFVPSVFVVMQHSLESENEEIRDAIQYWQANSEEGDVSYIGHSLRNEFHYYTMDVEVANPESIAVGHATEGAFDDTAKVLGGNKRVWVLLRQEDDALNYCRLQLDALGNQLDEQVWGSDTLWLYDLSSTEVEEQEKEEIPEAELPEEDLEPISEKTVEPTNIE